MIYHPRTPREAVNLRKEHADTAVYLAGGTDDLRLGGAAEGKDLIDITGFDFNTITEKDGKVYIGALCTLQDVIESELVPAFIQGGRRLLRLLCQAKQCDGRRQPRPAPLRQLSCRRADCGGRGAQIHHAARRAGQARRRIPAKRLQASDRVCRGR